MRCRCEGAELRMQLLIIIGSECTVCRRHTTLCCRGYSGGGVSLCFHESSIGLFLRLMYLVHGFCSGMLV